MRSKWLTNLFFIFFLLFYIAENFTQNFFQYFFEILFLSWLYNCLLELSNLIYIKN